MNRLAKWMMRLYPARWRRRYGDELDALLAETGADVRVVADLFRGGVRMQFSSWSFAKLAVVLGLVGLLLGAAGSFLIAPIYVSSATVEMTSLSAEPASTALNDELRRMEPEILSRTSLAQIINLPQLQLYERERRNRPLEDVIEEMKSAVRMDTIAPAGSPGNRAALRISFQYPDPAKAQEVTAILIQKFVDGSFQAKIDPAAVKHYLAVIDPASLPVDPALMRRGTEELLGGLLCLPIPFVWRRLRKKKLATWGVAVSMIAFGLAGSIAADVAYGPWPDSGGNFLRLDYRSSATMFIQNGTPEQLQTLATDARSRTTLSMIINDPRLDLYKDQKRTQPLEDVILNMQRHLAITPSGQYFIIAFEYPDRFKAQQSVNAIMIQLDDAYKRAYSGLPDAPVQSSPTTIRLIEAASTPVTPVSPNRYAIAIKGGIAGLVLAALIAAIRRRWKPEADFPVDAVNG